MRVTMSLMMTLLQKGIKLESSIAGLPPAQRAAARQQARLAERAGTADRDEPGHAERADRLILASIRGMSDADLMDYVGGADRGLGGYADFVLDEACEELERRGVVRPDDEDREDGERWSGLE
jgi:hypothetical protein